MSMINNKLIDDKFITLQHLVQFMSPLSEFHNVDRHLKSKREQKHMWRKMNNKLPRGHRLN